MMSDQKRYVLIMDCHSKEDHDGERYIDEEEFQKIKARSKQGEVNLNCSQCNLKVTDEEGNLIFSHCQVD